MKKLALKLAWIIRATEKQIENPLKEAWKRIREDKVVRLALQLITKEGCKLTFQEAIEKAEYCRRLRKAFLQAQSGQAVKFQFRKKDNSIREAFGTALDAQKLKRTGSGSKSETCAYYFDLEKKAARCFKIENLIISPLQFVLV